MIRKISFILLMMFLLASAVGGLYLYEKDGLDSSTGQMAQIVTVANETVVDCAKIAARKPFVILALGQSNAANHGARSDSVKRPVLLFSDGKCIVATDPLPGGTGNGGSVWSRLPDYFRASQTSVLISVMGIDSTSIAEWTADQSPLKRRLMEHIESMKVAGVLPHVILWQQGEADAQRGTTRDAYGAGLDRLERNLAQAGTDAVIVAALSTVCRSPPNTAIRAAIKAKATNSSRFQVGPDTDTLIDADSRIDGCHFSSTGLDQAAELWARELQHIFDSI